MSQTDTTWSYQGDTGPEHWGQLRDEYQLCERGTKQSPVDLPEPVEPAESGPLRILGGRVEGRVKDDRTTFRVSFNRPQRTLQWDERVYALQEFHFHAPSEHTVAGERYSMEAHFVHKDPEGNLLVLGLFLVEGEPGDAWRTVQRMTADPGGPPEDVPFEDLLPDSGGYYAYDGSLTTPPCSEGVQWVLFRSCEEVESDWIAQFEDRYGPTNRPLQPLNERTIHCYGSAARSPAS